MSASPKTETVKTSELRVGDVVWNYGMRTELRSEPRIFEGYNSGTTYAFTGTVTNAREFDKGGPREDSYIAYFMHVDGDVWTIQGNDLATWQREVKVVNEAAIADAERTLGRLDTEEDDNERAILIDHMIELSDLYPEVHEMWKQYR
jgi:hypothetical protein